MRVRQAVAIYVLVGSWAVVASAILFFKYCQWHYFPKPHGTPTILSLGASFGIAGFIFIATGVAVLIAMDSR